MKEKNVETNQLEEELVCEFCDATIKPDEIKEMSKSKNSTVLCRKCANKFNNISDFYDDE